MNKKNVFFTIIIFVLLSAHFLLLSNMLAAPSVMRGIVIADSKILSDDGKIYKIINSGKTFVLSDFIGKRIEVFGTVEDIDGETEIILNSFKILTDFSNQRSS